MLVLSYRRSVCWAVLKILTSCRQAGALVDAEPCTAPDNNIELRGEYVTLTAMTTDYFPEIWGAFDLLGDGAFLLQYLDMPPINSQEDWEGVLHEGMNTEVATMYVVKADGCHLNPRPGAHPGNHNEVLGIASYKWSAKHREIEIGLMFSPRLSRSAAATEAHYLMLCNVCEVDSPGLGGKSLPYRRVVWKCDARNEASNRAATRSGYTREATLRKHMIVKGRSRDTAMYSIIDDDWPLVKAALEEWLSRGNFDDSGRQIKRVEEIRALLGQIEHRES